MKLAIIDKDGTLVRPKSGAKFVGAPDDQELIPGVKEAIAKLKDEGCTLTIASNQGGVASGHKTLGSALDEMIFAMELTGIELAMFAPSYENEDYGEAIFIDRTDGGQRWKPVTSHLMKFRKPNPGMIYYLSKIALDLPKPGNKVLLVGDRLEDEAAAKAANVRFVWANDWLKA